MEVQVVSVANKAKRVRLVRRASTKVAGRQIRCMATAFSSGQLVESILETGLQTSKKELAS